MDFAKFYQHKLKPRVEELERLRRAMVPHLCLKAGLTVVGLLALMIFLMQPGVEFWGHTVVLFILFLALFLAPVLVYYAVTDPYRKQYKDQILRESLKELNSNFFYESSKGLTENYFHDSLIFAHVRHTSFYIKKDLFLLDTGDSGFLAVCEIEVGKKSGKNSITIFRGLFGMVESGLQCGSPIIVKARKREKKEKFSFHSYGHIVKKEYELEPMHVGDAVFSQIFNVYARDQKALSQVLSDKVCDGILTFKKQLDQELHLSFVNDRLYFMCPFRLNLFDPPIFVRLTLERIRRDYDLLEALVMLKQTLALPAASDSTTLSNEMKALLAEN